MKFCFSVLVAAFVLGGSQVAVAQEQVIGADPLAAAPQGNAWASSCSSTNRTTVGTCQLSQRAVSSQSRRLLAGLTLQFPAGGGAGIMVIQTPVGVALKPGVTFDVDGAGQQTLAFEACDRNGCYASTPLSPDLLTAMQAGQKFNIAIQSTQKQVATIPMTLAGFTAAYTNVK